MTPHILHLIDAASALETSPAFEADRIRFLYRHAPTGLAVNIALASLMTWALWERIPQQLLLTWVAAVLLVTLARTYGLVRYHRLQPTDEVMVRWRTEFLMGSVCSAMTWGATGALFTPFSSFEIQVFITFALGGLAGGAAVVLGSVLRVYLSYLVIIMAPITTWFLFQDTDMGPSMGAMLCVFSTAMIFTGVIYRRVLLRSLILAAQNDALITANSAVLKANRNLGEEIRRRKKLEKELRKREECFRMLYDDNPSMFFTLDGEGMIHSVNRFGAQQLGYEISELVGRNIATIQPPEETEHTRTWLASCCSEPDVEHRRETRKLRRDGTVIWVQETGRLQAESDGPSTILTVCQDISEARALSEQLIYQASHDPLTDLYNRRKFEHIVDSLLMLPDDGNKQHVLCYLDLDRFKIINDTCGHAAGDRLLQELGRLFWSKSSDGITIARLGGDEFGLLLEQRSLPEALEVIHDIRAAINALDFCWGNNTFKLETSVGVVEIGTGRHTFDAALSAADRACYAAKDKGLNRVHVFLEGDQKVAKRHGEMQRVVWLQNALQHGRLRLVQQPILPLRDQSQRMQFVEILLRFVEDSGRMLEPGEFLLAAERYGISSQIDRWVIRSAIACFSSNDEQLQRLGHFSINLSGCSVGDEEFMKFLTREIKYSTIAPRKFCFEITETAAIANIEAAKYMIDEIRALGCHFALDDFGSGVSSFGYLRNLPVDFIKVDGMFVRNICEDPADLAMVQSISELGHVMGKQIIAEFVESPAILEKMKALGVDYAQGYAIGKPEPLTTATLPCAIVDVNA